MGEPTFDCLFPIEQRVTGMNSAVQTASLTGRILFFYCSEPLLTSDLIRSTESVHPPLFASPPNPPGVCRECSNGSLNVGTSPSAEAPNALSWIETGCLGGRATAEVQSCRAACLGVRDLTPPARPLESLLLSYSRSRAKELADPVSARLLEQCACHDPSRARMHVAPSDEAPVAQQLRDRRRDSVRDAFARASNPGVTWPR